MCSVRHLFASRLPEGKDERVIRSSADLAAMREEYAAAGLSLENLAGDWPTQFGGWFAQAEAAGLAEPNAMIVATADEVGRPSVRTVLLKGFDQGGFTFFTNYESRKGTEIAANPSVGLLFPWHPLGRQVVVAGEALRVGRAETDAYFATRPRGSQLGAWASPQSRVVESREVLDAAWAAADARYPGEIPAPPHWGGLRVVPRTVEFWQGRPGRMHDRLRFRRVDGDDWIIERLAP
jgi:pyridoxamine 5'-phosphate oxidase